MFGFVSVTTPKNNNYIDPAMWAGKGADVAAVVVGVVDDINVKILDCAHNRGDEGEQNGPVPSHWIGTFLLIPNSLRRDIQFMLALPSHPKVKREPWDGKDMDKQMPPPREGN